MKILLLYASHGGATRTCAELLAEHLNLHHSVTVLPEWQTLPAPTEFDAVIIGSPIRIGNMNKSLKHYIRQHREELSNMPFAVFFCCGYPRQFEEYVETQLPKGLVCSLGTHCFGGELKPEKLKGLDKWIVKAARSSIRSQDFEESDADHHDLPEIIPENIKLLANEIQKLPKNG